MTTTAQASTHLEDVFSQLLREIVAGRYGQGRLPAERALAARLGSSRATLREALGRLAAWNLVEARRGSGVVVLARRRWSIEVLPAYLQYGPHGGQDPALGRLVGDLLQLRRALLVELTRGLGDRLAPGDLDQARQALERACALAQAGGAAFVAADLEMTRSLLEAAGMLPALWLLNRFSGVYLELARLLTGAVRPPEDYRATHEACFVHLEAGDAQAAARLLDDYLGRHDGRLLDLLRGAPSP